MKNIFTISICLLLLATNQFVKAQCNAGQIGTLRDTICDGTPASLTVKGSNGNIQWQSSTADTFANITGATDSLYKTNPLLQTTYFRVVVSNGNCADTSAVFRVFIPAPLTANFTTATTGSYTISFNSDSSKGNIVSYHWDFGDGDTSTIPNPVHTYTKDSTYYPCLTIYDGSDCSYTFCRYLDEGWENGGQCPPSFGCYSKGDTVYCSANGDPFYDSFLWDFSGGIGIGGSNQNPIFLCSSQGIYNVCVLMIDYEDMCSGQTCQNVSVGINNIVPRQQTIVLYPNPCTYCEIKGVQNVNDLLVTDLLGRVVPVSFSKQSNGYQLNFPFADSGMYLIKNVRTGEVVKFVRE